MPATGGNGDCMSLSTEEEQLLRRALELARTARASGNPPFGSLLVDADGRVIAEDVNTTLTEADITAHPELKLARWAAREVAIGDRGAVTMFTSCQPCPMCAEAISRSGIGRVVFALSNDQLEDVKPAGTPSPRHPWTADGPHLFPESTGPLDGYYTGPA